MTKAREEKQLYADDPETGEPKTDVWIATSIEANERIAQRVLDAPVTPDDNHEGRSAWRWFRLANGDLILGCYPKGDTYFETELDRKRP